MKVKKDLALYLLVSLHKVKLNNRSPQTEALFVVKSIQGLGLHDFHGTLIIGEYLKTEGEVKSFECC